MMSPGMEQRGVKDRDCAVTCGCGEELFRLAPGERVASADGAADRTVSATCNKCNRTTTLRVKGVSGG